MQYIRDTYGVPAKRGGRIEYGPNKVLGTITGTRNAHLIIRMDGEKHSHLHHPTWNLRYLPSSKGGAA